MTPMTARPKTDADATDLVSEPYRAGSRRLEPESADASPQLRRSLEADLPQSEVAALRVPDRN